MFEDDDQEPLSSLCMQVGYRRSPAVAVPEKWSVAEQGMGEKWQAVRVDEEQEGWAGEDRGRGCQMPPRESRPHRQRSGRKGPKVGSREGWSDRSVRVSSSIHHTVPLWFNQTRNVLNGFDCRSTGDCVVMQTPVPTCPYQTKISSNQMTRHVSLSHWNLYTLVKYVFS